MTRFRCFTLAVFTAVILWPGTQTVIGQAQVKALTGVASTTIIQDITKNVAGDKLTVDFLVPTDGDVHQFQPSRRILRRSPMPIWSW